MARREELQEEQWAVVEPLLPKLPRRADGRGRPRCADRAVLNGILWILRSGARWKDLPARFPSYQTCHRRFQRWVHDGTLARALQALAEDLQEWGGLDLSECFIDGTFIVAKRGGRSGQGQAGQRDAAHGSGRPRWSASRRAHRARYASRGHPRSGHAGRSACGGALPARLIGDRAYDSDPLDAFLSELGIAMIAPHRRNRTKPPTQDGRSLRRYKQRWKVERLFAWLGNFRRLVVRYEYHAANYLGFVQIGFLLILLRYL